MRKKSRSRSGWFFAITSVLVLATVNAQDRVFAAQPFEATCQSASNMTFRNGTGNNEDLNGWSKDEKFFSTWKFQFNGSKAFIDDVEAGVLAETASSLVIAEGGSGEGDTVSVLLYVINQNLNKIVAGTVNSYNTNVLVPSTGVKVRAIEFNCVFEY